MNDCKTCFWAAYDRQTGEIGCTDNANPATCTHSIPRERPRTCGTCIWRHGEGGQCNRQPGNPSVHPDAPGCKRYEMVLRVRPSLDCLTCFYHEWHHIGGEGTSIQVHCWLARRGSQFGSTECRWRCPQWEESE